MRIALSIILFFIATAALNAVDLKVNRPAEAPPELSKWIGELGDPDFRTREAASKKLFELGSSALNALESSADSDLPEIAERSRQLLGRIRAKIANDEATAPTWVELPTAPRTLNEHFADLHTNNGFEIVLEGDQAKRLETFRPQRQKDTFWNQLGAICDAHDLEIASVETGTGASLIWGPSRGKVSLRDRKDPKYPTCTFGNLRIEARPLAPEFLEFVPRDRLVFSLRVWAEPGTAFQRATSTVVVESRSKTGSPLGTDSEIVRFGHSIPTAAQAAFARTVSPSEASPFPPNSIPVTLIPNEGGPIVARSMRGQLHFEGWTPTRQLAAVVLEPGSSNGEVKTEEGIALTVRVGSGGKFTVKLQFRTLSVRPEKNTTNWNATEAGPRFQKLGLTAFDVSNRQVHHGPDAKTERLVEGCYGFQAITTLELPYKLLASNADAALPTLGKLIFRGSVLQSFSAPFEFHDVPLQFGTRDDSKPITRPKK